MRDIRGLDPAEETQVEGAWVPTRTLELDERGHRQTGISTTTRGTVLIDSAEQNNAYTEQPARQAEMWRPTVFISY